MMDRDSLAYHKVPSKVPVQSDNCCRSTIHLNQHPPNYHLYHQHHHTFVSHCSLVALLGQDKAGVCSSLLSQLRQEAENPASFA